MEIEKRGKYIGKDVWLVDYSLGEDLPEILDSETFRYYDRTYLFPRSLMDYPELSRAS